MSRLKIGNHDLVVVCDGRKALFLQNDGDEQYLNLVTCEAREQADPPNRELNTDRPGRVHQSAVAARSAVELTDRHDEAERSFIEGVAARLSQLATQDKRRHVVVVAPPRALGILRKAYAPALRTAVAAEIGHDWTHLPVYEIEQHLKAEIKGSARQPTG